MKSGEEWWEVVRGGIEWWGVTRSVMGCFILSLFHLLFDALVLTPILTLIITKNHYQKSSPKIITKNHHQKSSPKIITKNHHPNHHVISTSYLLSFSSPSPLLISLLSLSYPLDTLSPFLPLIPLIPLIPIIPSIPIFSDLAYPP